MANIAELVKQLVKIYNFKRFGKRRKDDFCFRYNITREEFDYIFNIVVYEKNRMHQFKKEERLRDNKGRFLPTKIKTIQ